MVEGINYLHLLKIAHRDLKPENFLFLTKDSNNIKLIDFGLAMRWDVNLKAELKKKGDKKIVGTVTFVLCSLTTSLLRSSMLITTSDVIFGPLELFSTSCCRLHLLSTEKMTRRSSSQSRP